MNKIIYFDNAATTKPYKEALEVFNSVASDFYANPSALHNLGYDAEKKIKESKKVISNILNCNLDEIFFTSSATESNNIFLQGVTRANMRNGKEIITTYIEHPSVINTLNALEDDGFVIRYVKCDDNGLVDINHLKTLLSDDTILVSIMHTNNEIGTIEPVEEIVKVVKNYNSDIIVHSDMVQSIGKIKIDLSKTGLDGISASSHKFHGIRGCGFLYIKNKTKIKSLIHGGGQEKDIRPGTENTPAICASAKALEIADSNLNKNYSDILELKKYLIEQLTYVSKKTNIKIGIVGSCIEHIKGDIFLPNILSVYIEDVRSEVLLHTLEEYNIYVSSGSACSNNHKEKSKTLKAVNLPDKYNDSVIRISLSEYNSIDEIDYFIKVLYETLPRLTKYTRK